MCRAYTRRRKHNMLSNYEQTLRSFPHWLDKSPYSNFSKTIRVLNRQYRDKQHKIRTLEYAKKLYKPIRIHKEQTEPYKYDILFESRITNMEKVNIYINPMMNDEEEIIQYEKMFTYNYPENTQYNNLFTFTYHGDTRREWTDPSTTNTYDYTCEEETYVLKETFEDIIIPKDTFVIEIYTYDDYRWVKGFPENDNEELFKIYKESKSYTDYLTFNIRKDNIKNIRICKGDTVLYEQNFTDLTLDDNPVIYHDYLPDMETNTKIDSSDVLVSDPSDTNHKVQVILHDDDYEITFDYTSLLEEYPDTTKYIHEYLLNEHIPASEDTLGKVLIRKRNDHYNAYKTTYNGNSYEYTILSYNLPHTKTLLHNYDCYITLYDKEHPHCELYDKVLHKRYTGNDKTNYDCFMHDYSLDMLGKWWNIPRLKFNPTAYRNKCGKQEKEYYEKTYPSYNDKLTEDDYHYQNRITRYIQGYNKDYFPVLELWKNYQVWCGIRNRKDILSTQGKSYLGTYEYYEDSIGEELSGNKLKITQGKGNRVNINNTSWHENVLANQIYIIPQTQYHFKCKLLLKQPYNNERTSLHIYYLNKGGDCTKEETIILQPKFTDTTINEELGTIYEYQLEDSFTTIKDGVMMDIVLEGDNEYEFNNATLYKKTLVSKDSMYMATKNNYNSCVYDFTVDYNDVPTNIEFSNSKIFEKILQRSLPLTHKGFLNIKHTDTVEAIGLTDSFGEIRIKNFFDNLSNTDERRYRYDIPINSLIKEGKHYTLNVHFTNTDTSTDEDYIIITFIFKDNENNILEYEPTPLNVMLEPDTETILNHHFTPPENSVKMNITFHTESNTEFKYEQLSLTREEPVELEELWTR